MIISLILAAHLVFGLVIYTKKWQEEGIKSAVINLVLIAILFSVGWSVVTIPAKLIMEPKGLGIFFDRDTFALTILAAAEFFFYKIYYFPAEKDKEELTGGGKEIQ
jgi:hypothetical protein